MFHPKLHDRDALLDRFMPEFDIVERHERLIDAPPEKTFQAEKNINLDDSKIARLIFRAREVLMRAGSSNGRRPAGLIAMTKSLGWGVLAEEPGREIVMGAITQPWLPNPVFRALPPEGFAAFSEPGYIKIAWMLRADPADGAQSLASTETRAVATDPTARRRFLVYWRRVRPGVILIRELALRLLKRTAER